MSVLTLSFIHVDYILAPVWASSVLLLSLHSSHRDKSERFFGLYLVLGISRSSEPMQLSTHSQLVTYCPSRPTWTSRSPLVSPADARHIACKGLCVLSWLTWSTLLWSSFGNHLGCLVRILVTASIRMATPPPLCAVGTSHFFYSSFFCPLFSSSCCCAKSHPWGLITKNRVSLTHFPYDPSSQIYHVKHFSVCD